MARRRFRSNQRHEPTTERSFQEYILSTPAPQTSRTELLRLIRGGEDTFLELKVKLSNTEKIAQEIVALANTGGGVIVFGVNDQLRVEGVEDPERVQDELVRICREEVQPALVPFIDRVALDNGRRIVALDIESKRRPYRTRDGRFYLRIGAEKREASREEISSLLDEARPLRYEDVPALGSTITDIDEAHLWSYLREFEGGAFEEATVIGYPTAEVLERDLLLATNDGQETIPTVAGLLLFGRDERVAELLPRASVTATRFSGDSLQSPVIERVKLSGNLLSLYEGLTRFIRRYRADCERVAGAGAFQLSPRHSCRGDYKPARAQRFGASRSPEQGERIRSLVGVCKLAPQHGFLARCAKSNSLWNAGTFESSTVGSSDQFCVWSKTQSSGIARAVA
jgi:ATP-dependent DNA helicase RecG